MLRMCSTVDNVEYWCTTKTREIADAGIEHLCSQGPLRGDTNGIVSDSLTASVGERAGHYGLQVHAMGQGGCTCLS